VVRLLRAVPETNIEAATPSAFTSATQDRPHASPAPWTISAAARWASKG
jgi:hypothetical protein